MNKYKIIIYWSDDDSSFLAEVPELSGCMAHGQSYEEALANIHEAIIAKELWIESARSEGKPVPEPRYRPAIYQLA